MPNIKNIIFDLGGVIINLDAHRLLDAFAEVGIPHAEQFLTGENAKQLWLASEVGGIDAHEFCNRLRQLSGKDVDDERLIWAWNQFLVGTTNERKARILDLHRHYRVFLLSNTNDMHWQWSVENVFTDDCHTLPDFFDRVFLSYEMHLAKPSSEIFEEVLRIAGLQHDETLFIDDSQDNCAAASLLGIQVYHNRCPDDWLTFLQEL